MLKKILLIMIVVICSLLVGCKKKVKCTINEEYYATFISKNNSGAVYNDHDDIYEPIYIEMRKCYMFNEYDELYSFLNENDLAFYDEKLESKYDEKYFEDNVLILYLDLDGEPKVKYDFKLVIEDDKLIFNVNRSFDTKGDWYAIIENYRMFFCEIEKNEIQNINSIELIRKNNGKITK